MKKLELHEKARVAYFHVYFVLFTPRVNYKVGNRNTISTILHKYEIFLNKFSFKETSVSFY